MQFESENVGRPMAGHTTWMWERITSQPGPLIGQTIVDFGCGPGRFLDVLRRKGARAIGIDLSRAADVGRRNFADNPHTLILQADLLRPPLREGSFDGGLSIGILHHTPRPDLGMARLAAAIRPGGWVSCCVYPKGDFHDVAPVKRWRAVWGGFRRRVDMRRRWRMRKSSPTSLRRCLRG